LADASRFARFPLSVFAFLLSRYLMVTTLMNRAVSSLSPCNKAKFIHCTCSAVVQPDGTGMIFFSFFKTLVGKEVAIELKNDVVITGVLLSVDQYLNVKLKNVVVVNSDAHPQLAAMKNCFIRGSAVR
jgi:U6 snRNA-associated Sm-like protein LSm2